MSNALLHVGDMESFIGIYSNLAVLIQAVIFSCDLPRSFFLPLIMCSSHAVTN
jgi:hypothetical protein